MHSIENVGFADAASGNIAVEITDKFLKLCTLRSLPTTPLSLDPSLKVPHG